MPCCCNAYASYWLQIEGPAASGEVSYFLNCQHSIYRSSRGKPFRRAVNRVAWLIDCHGKSSVNHKANKLLDGDWGEGIDPGKWSCTVNRALTLFQYIPCWYLYQNNLYNITRNYTIPITSCSQFSDYSLHWLVQSDLVIVLKCCWSYQL